MTVQMTTAPPTQAPITAMAIMVFLPRLLPPLLAAPERFAEEDDDGADWDDD